MTKNTIINRLVIARIILAFLVAGWMVLNRSWNRIGEALHLPRFYVALAISFAIAYLILWVIHFSNRILDQRFLWRPNLDKPAWKQLAFYVRGLLQLLLGLALPAMIDLILVGIYLEAIGRDLWASGYLNLDFPTVVLLMAILNGIYIIFPITREQRSPTNDYRAKTTEEHVLSIEHDGTHVNLRISQDVLCFIKKGRYVHVLSTHGSRYTAKESLNVLEERYAPANFVRINRAIIVNVGCIKGYKTSHRKQYLDLIFKPIYHDYIKGLDPELFSVTRDRNTHFKNIYRRIEKIMTESNNADLQPVE